MKRFTSTTVFIGICAIAIQAQIHAQANLPKEIRVGKAREITRKEIYMPEIDGYRLLKCDFHIHTVFSDGIVWPTLRVNEAWEEGLDAIAITDHIEGQPSRRAIEKGNHNNSYEIAREEALRRDLILIRGGEITRHMPPGHLNAIFLKDVTPLDQPDYMKVLEEAHRQGAFIFWNHPGWGVNEIKWYDVHETLLKNGWLNGIEVFNELEWYPTALHWVNERNLTLIANSDVHDVTDRLYDPLSVPHRPMTLVLSKERSEEGIREALFARRTIIYFFNTLMGKAEWLEKFLFASLEIHPAHYTENNQRFVHVTNRSSVPFTLRRMDVADKYPDNISIPARQTILLALPVPDAVNPHPVAYEVENMIVTPTKKLSVKLF